MTAPDHRRLFERVRAFDDFLRDLLMNGDVLLTFNRSARLSQMDLSTFVCDAVAFCD
ncbi:MAG TPA: hypothetical protein VNN16_08470 [Candidatus Sulfotelmatobacter sp.]|nr:hypothetical protein [Candidatus Sulfotelmatobacter sp.]